MLQLAAASLAKTGKSFQHTAARAILLGEKCIDDCPKTQFFRSPPGRQLLLIDLIRPHTLLVPCENHP
jgi:hypothetical protein